MAEDIPKHNRREAGGPAQAAISACFRRRPDPPRQGYDFVVSSRLRATWQSITMTRAGRTWIFTLMAAFAAAAFCATATPASAQSRYDGRWSVLIITDKGTCDRAYRYSVRIERGVIVYGGEAGVRFTGRVDRRGRLRATISRGSTSANGTGRLTRVRGAGVWSGRSPTAQCSGRWEAERRTE
jgi:hypothetical protein